MDRVQSKRRKVLLVEDDAELRLLTKTILQEAEFDILECDSAEAALATVLLQGQEVAMIFADIRLSGVMDGIDLAREVKMRWPHLVVVLTSGNAREHLDQLPPGVYRHEARYRENGDNPGSRWHFLCAVDAGGRPSPAIIGSRFMDHADNSGRVPWGRILLLGCVAAGGLYWAFFRTDVVEDPSRLLR